MLHPPRGGSNCVYFRACHMMANLRKEPQIHYAKNSFANWRRFCPTNRPVLACSIKSHIAVTRYPLIGSITSRAQRNPKANKYKVRMAHFVWNLIVSSLGTGLIAEKKTIAYMETRGDYKMKYGRIYRGVAASWVWLLAKSQSTISNDSLKKNRTSIWHQLCSLIGRGNVTSGNP